MTAVAMLCVFFPPPGRATLMAHGANIFNLVCHRRLTRALAHDLFQFEADGLVGADGPKYVALSDEADILRNHDCDQGALVMSNGGAGDARSGPGRPRLHWDILFPTMI